MDNNTSWESVEPWYTAHVGEKGHHYHQAVILPNLLRLLKKPASLLDIGCGQGVLARSLPDTAYTGLDASASLIAAAQKLNKNPNARFLHADATLPLPLTDSFEAAVFLLSLQNMEHPDRALLAVRPRLSKRGRLLLVLNHPCFRIPRQSSWEVDTRNKLQYRRINRYLSQLNVPIQMEPGKGDASAVTYSFHRPLSDIMRHLAAARFVVETIEEWSSDKKSEGSKARMEDRARAEIPLFMAIVARAD